MNLSIENVRDDTVKRLRERARMNRRSLQGEFLAILEAALAKSFAGSAWRLLRRRPMWCTRTALHGEVADTARGTG